MSRGRGPRDLTPEQLEALLASLDPDREKAGLRYEEIRRRLIRFFEWRGCEPAEDLTDETINRVARQLALDLSLRSDPYAYFLGVARLVRLEYLRKKAKENQAIHNPTVVNPGESEDDPHPLLEHLRHCLGTLPAGQRALVLRYYQGERRIQNRKVLCEELRIEMNALRIRVHRIRRKIETCIQERRRS